MEPKGISKIQLSKGLDSKQERMGQTNCDEFHQNGLLFTFQTANKFENTRSKTARVQDNNTVKLS